MLESNKAKASVTCLINVRNGQRYIREAIDSVVNQTIPVHLIVIDNQSSDQTAAIVQQEYPDAVLVKTPTAMTLGAARNFSLNFLSSEFVAWLDVDDVWEPDFCAVSLQAFTHNPQAVLVSSATILIDEHGQPLPGNKQRLMARQTGGSGFTEGDTLDKLLFKLRSEASWQSYMFRSAAVRQVNGFDSKLKFAMDLDLIAKLLLLGDAVHIQQNLSRCRIHNQQVTVHLDPFLRYGECYHILAELLEKAGLTHKVSRKNLWSIIRFRISLAFFLERRSLFSGLKASCYLFKPAVALWVLRRALSYHRY